MAEVVALLAERREEIKTIGKLYREMASTIGEDAAAHLLCEAIATEARAAGRKACVMSRQLPSLGHFAQMLGERGKDGGMDGISHILTDGNLFVSVARCDYFALYNSSGLPKAVATALCCGREAPFAKGYDHRLKLIRQEVRPGNGHSCRLVYAWDETEPPPGEGSRTSLRVRNP